LVPKTALVDFLGEEAGFVAYVEEDGWFGAARAVDGHVADVVGGVYCPVGFFDEEIPRPRECVGPDLVAEFRWEERKEVEAQEVGFMRTTIDRNAH
jgi:hypothetical protein